MIQGPKVIFSAIWAWGVEFAVRNTSAAQVANSRAKIFIYCFSFCSGESYTSFHFDFFTFAIAPLYVYKRSYIYKKALLDCEGHCYRPNKDWRPPYFNMGVSTLFNELCPQVCISRAKPLSPSTGTVQLSAAHFSEKMAEYFK